MRDMDKDVERTVRAATRRWARRCFWTDERDLYGWGIQIALEALRTWNEARGPKLVYLRSALARGLWRRVLRESAPVSTASDHKLRELVGLTRASVDVLAYQPSERGWADQVLEDRDWHRRVAGVLGRVARGKVEQDGVLGLAVLLGAKAHEVARDNGVPAWRVREAAEQVAEAVQQTPVLQALLRERL